MVKRAYQVFGGPCHWDVLFKFYVVFSPSAARREGINNRNIKSRTEQAINTLQNQFNRIFNPEAKQGVYKLYPIPPCCNFHISVEFLLPPSHWQGKSMGEVRNSLPDGTGAIALDDIGWLGNPYADIGGQLVVAPLDGDASTLAHEIGHILGLEDKYSHLGKTVHGRAVPPNKVSPEEEKEYAGRLMGKKKNGKREITYDDALDIVRVLGLTCDVEKCCPGRVVEHEPIGPETPEENNKKVKMAQCVVGLKTGAVIQIDQPKKCLL